MKVNKQCKNRRIAVLAILILFCLTALAGAAALSTAHATAYAENGVSVETPAYAVGVTAYGTETGYDDFVTAFMAAETLSSAEGTRVTVKLYGAVQFTEQLSVSKEADITLNLNGFALRRRNLQVEENTFDLPYYPDSGVDTGMIFEIRGKLTLDDSAPERIHTNADREKIGVPLYTKLPSGGLVTGSYMTRWNYGGLFNVLGGELIINGGKIYGNSGTGGGTNSAVVYLTCGESYNSSKLTMNGGEISGNFFPAIVRGQRKDYATFDMNGGRIANNGIFCEDLIDDTADYGKTDVNNVFRNYDLAVTNYSMNVTVSGDAYLYDNYYVPSKYAYFHEKVNAHGKPTYPESYWDMEEEKALKVGTDGGYGDYEDWQAYAARMQPNMALYVYNTYDLSANASFSIAGNFTGKVGLYDYRELLGSETKYDRSAKIIAYKLLSGADMNGTVEIVDANHASFKGDDPSYYYLPDGVTAPTERYDAVREGVNCVLYRKFDVSVSQSGNDYYQEEENGFPSAAATATTLGLDGKIVSVEGTLTYEKQYQQGKQTVGYTFTPTLKNLYGIRMGSFDVTGQAVRELKVTYNGGSHPSGTKLSDIQNEFAVSLIYQNGHTVALTPSQYTLAFGEGTGGSRTELRGGSNAIYATYVGASGATYKGFVIVSVDGVGFEVYNGAYIGDNTQVTVYNTFDEAIGAALALQDSVIVMYEDVIAKNPITIPASKRITLDLNGHVINLSDLPATFEKVSVYMKGYYYKVTQSPFITVVGANSSFTISDSSPDAAHTNADLPRGGVLTGMRYNSVVRVENGYFMLGGGTIYKNVIDRLLSHSDGKYTYGIEDNPIFGAAINLSGGDAEIGTYAVITANGVMSRSTAAKDGHVVLDNSETVRGGAVYVSQNSRLIVYGKIEGNAASTVGGIYIQGGDVVLEKNSTVSGNEAYFGDGSGIKLSSGSLTVNGGQVSGNLARKEYSENVGVYTSGSFTMNGGTLTDEVYQARGNAVLLGGEIVSYRWNAGSVSLGVYDKKASSVVIDNLYMVNKRINVYGKFSGTVYVSTDKRPTAAGARIRLTALGDSRAEVSEANILSFDPTIDTAKIDGEIYFMAPRTEVSLILDIDEYYPGAAFPEITLISATAKIDGVWVDVPGKLYWLDPPETAPIAYYGTSYKYVFEPDDNLTYKTKIGSISLAPIAVTKIEATLSGDFPTKLYTDTAPESILPYITVTRTWASGRVDTLQADEFTVSLPPTFVVGANAIGIRSEACKKTYTTTVTLTVNEVVTTGIDVEFRQSQNLFVETRVTDYPAIFGDDLKVWLNYNNGKRERIQDYVISPQPRYVGSQELSIVYGDYSKPINVYIRGVSLSGIEGIFSDSGRSRVRTDFTLEQLKPYITARYIYNNGAYGDSIDLTTGIFNVYYPTGVSGLHAGYNTLNISFRSEAGGVAGTKYYGAVQIPVVEVESFTVAVDQTNTTIFTSTKAEDLKTLLAGKLTITANYNDGTTETVTDRVVLSGDFNVRGEVTVTLGAQAATGTFTVDVTTPELTGITASIDESKSYRLWTTDTPEAVKEKLPLIVRATYTDGSVRELTKGEYTLSSSVEPYEKYHKTHYWPTVGRFEQNTVTIQYLGKTVGVLANFGNVYIDKLEINKTAGLYLYEGDLPDYKLEDNNLSISIKKLVTEGRINVSVVYSDGSKLTTTDAEWKQTIIDSLSAEYYVNGKNCMTYGDNKIKISSALDTALSGYVTLWGNQKIPVSFQKIDPDQGQGDIQVYTSQTLEEAADRLWSVLRYSFTYNDGSTSQIYGLTYTILSGRMDQPGEVTIRVSPRDYPALGSFEFTFTVTAVEPESLSVTVLEDLSISQNGDLNLIKNKIKVFLINNDGKKGNGGNALRSDEYTLSGDVSNVGATKISASYTFLGKTYRTEFDVTVTVPKGKLETAVDFSDFTPVAGQKVTDALEHITVYLVLDNGARTILDNSALTFGYAGGEITDETVFVLNADSKITVSYTYNETPLTASFTCPAVTEAPPQGAFSNFALTRQVYLHNSIDFLRKNSTFTYTAKNGTVITVEAGVGFTVTFKNPDQTEFIAGDNAVVFHMYGETCERTVNIKEAAVLVTDGILREAIGCDSIEVALKQLNQWDPDYRKDFFADVVTVTLMRDFINGQDGYTTLLPITVNHSKKGIILDLNGHIIDRGLTKAVENGSVIQVNGGNFTITDSRPDAEHPGYTKKDAFGGAIPLGGVITGGYSTALQGNKTASGGGILVDYGSTTSYTFTLNGGTIWNNATNGEGGGVYVKASRFVMNGGAIRANSSGVMLEKDSFSIGNDSVMSFNGGVIENNAGTSVKVNSGTFTMTGGEITNTKSKTRPLIWSEIGGIQCPKIYVYGGELTNTLGRAINAYEIYMAGNPIIKGGVYLWGKPISFDANFGGSFQAYFMSIDLKNVVEDNKTFYYQQLGTLISGAQILPSARITIYETADPHGNTHFALRTDKTNLGVVFEFQVLESAVSVRIDDVYEGYFNALPALTLADGGTPGKAQWTTSFESGKFTYTWRFTPDYKVDGVCGYAIVEKEYTVVPIAAVGARVDASASYTVYESTDVTSDAFKNRFTFALEYADGTEKLIVQKNFSIAFNENKTQLVFTLTQFSLDSDRGVYTLPVTVVPVGIDTVTATVKTGKNIFVSTTLDELKNLIDVKALNNDGNLYKGGALLASDYTLSFTGGATSFSRGTNVLTITIDHCAYELEIKDVIFGAASLTYQKYNNDSQTTVYGDDLYALIQSLTAMNDVRSATITLHTDFVPGGEFSMNGPLEIIWKSTKTGTLVFDLNGYVLDRGLTGAVKDGHVIKVRADGMDRNGTSLLYLTIQDGNPTRAHSGYQKAYPAGGVITGGNSTGHGGGIYIDKSATLIGSGYVALTMTGGTVWNNIADEGGGIFVATSYGVNIGNDVTVSGNTATTYEGGGICIVTSNGVVVIAGKICKNSATKNGGGGLSVRECKNVTISGEIYGNSAQSSGGVYALCNVTLENVKIYNNTAVFGRIGGFGSSDQDKSTLKGSVEIFGNTADGKASNFIIWTREYSDAFKVTQLVADGTVTGQIGFSIVQKDEGQLFPTKYNNLVFLTVPSGANITGLSITLDNGGADGVEIKRSEQSESVTYLLTVRGVTPNYEGATVDKTVYYDTYSLPDITHISATIPGTVAWDAGQTVKPGTNYYTWTFTPDDPDYVPIHGAIGLTYYYVVEFRPYNSSDNWSNLTGDASLTLDALKQLIGTKEQYLTGWIKRVYSDGSTDDTKKSEYSLEFSNGRTGWETSANRDVVNYFDIVYNGANGFVFRQTVPITIGKRTPTALNVTLDLAGDTISERDDIGRIRDYLTVSAQYEGSETAVTVTDYTVYGTLNAGKSVAEVYYGGLMREVEFDVQAVNATEVTGITLDYSPGGVQLTTEDTIDDLRSYLTVMLSYSDGAAKQITDYTVDEKPFAAGDNEMTVRYKDYEETFTAYLLQGIEIVWVTDDFTYDGTDQSAKITAYYLDANGKKVDLAVSGGVFKDCLGGVVFTAAFNEEVPGYILPSVHTKTYTMKQAALDVTANAHGIVYGAISANNGVKYEGFINGEDESVFTGSLGYTYSYTQYDDCGTYAITPAGLSAQNYEITYHSGVLTVSPAAVTLTIGDVRIKQGAAKQTLTATVTLGTVFNGDELRYTLSVACNDFDTSGKYAVTGTDDDKNYIITFVPGEYEIYSIAGYLEIKEKYGDLITKSPDELTWKEANDVSYMYSAYAMLDKDNLGEFSEDEKAAILALNSKASAVFAALNTANRALSALDGVTAIGLRGGDFNEETVAQAIETAKDKVKAFTDLSSGLKEADLEKYEKVAAAEKALADYDAYRSFQSNYGETYAKDSAGLTYGDCGEVTGMYAAYLALTDGVKGVLTEEEVENVAALKTKADALTTKKALTDSALDSLKTANADSTGKETLQELLADAQEKVDDFLAENGTAQDLPTYSAIEDSKIKISEYEKEEFEQQVKEDLGAIGDYTPDFVGGMDIPNLEDTIGKVQDAIDKIDASSDKTKDDLADKREELVEVKDDLTEKLNTEYEKQEFEQQIAEDLGAIEDYTPGAIGCMDIPNLEDTIGKVQDAIDKIDASSDKTKAELADKREELVEVKDNLTQKLNLENTKVEIIAELKAECEKLLASASYSASAKKEIYEYYANAIKNIAIATNVSSIEEQKNACIEGMNSVEILHVGLLASNIVFAVLFIGEILFLVFRKKIIRKKKETKTYSSALPLVLLAAASGGGLTVGVTFLVILILAVVVLGIYIADKILREIKGKTVFSPAADKVDEFAKKCVDGAKKCVLRVKKLVGKKGTEQGGTSDLAVHAATAAEELSETEAETADVESPEKKSEAETATVVKSEEAPQDIHPPLPFEYSTDGSNSDETAAAMNDEEETEVFRGIEAHTGLAILVRYKKSFLAKLIQCSDETKRYYSNLKNALLSYKKVTSRVSWSYESINHGRQKLAKFNVRGKTLVLYLALNPDDFSETKYKVERTESKKYDSTPCVYKIKNDKRAKYAIDLIAKLCSAFNLTSGESQSVDYAAQNLYDTTESLITRGLIKELITKENYEAYLKRQQQQGFDGKKREFVSASEVSTILSDEVAAALIEEKNVQSGAARSGKAEKHVRGIVNIDKISEAFGAGDTVTLSALQGKGLLAKPVNHYKILARGSLDKPLCVEANEFSIEAVKMILLTGGKVIKIKD